MEVLLLILNCTSTAVLVIVSVQYHVYVRFLKYRNACVMSRYVDDIFI